VTLAILRPDSWKLPLFLHVFGATVLFGATLTAAILGIAAVRRRDQAPLLSRLAFRATLLGVLPAWILARFAGQWILNREKEQIPGLDNKGWVGVGFIVTDAGLVLIVALLVLGYLSARRGGSGRLTTAFAVLAPVYLVALGVAWFAMSAKPGS
jgi:membrane protein YqaA with SNARE-associated domain